MKKLIIGLAIIVLLVVGVTILNAKKADAPHDQTSAPKSSTSQTSAPQSANAVTIKGYAFTPKNITIKKGTTVTWTNEDIAKHNVVVDDGGPAGGPDGPLFGKGETYKFTFDTVGTYNYHCSPHPYMKANVTVTE